MILRAIAGWHRHQAIPFAANQSVVSPVESLDAVGGLSRLSRRIIGPCPVTGLNKLAVELRHEKFAVHHVGSHHRIADYLEKSSPLIHLQLRHDAVDQIRDMAIVGQTTPGVIIVGKRIFRRAKTLILGRVPFDFPPHIFRLARPGQAVICVKYHLQRVFVILAEYSRKPCSLVMVDIVMTETGEIPRHVKKRLHCRLGRLDVTDIEQPIAVGTCVKSLSQLVIHQSRRRGAEPQIVMRRAEIGGVVIDASPTLARPLGRSAQALHVAVIVVGPHYGHVIGQSKSSTIQVKRLLVRDKNLRHILRVAVKTVAQDAALIRDDLLKQLYAL